MAAGARPYGHECRVVADELAEQLHDRDDLFSFFVVVVVWLLLVFPLGTITSTDDTDCESSLGSAVTEAMCASRDNPRTGNG